MVLRLDPELQVAHHREHLARRSEFVVQRLARMGPLGEGFGSPSAVARGAFAVDQPALVAALAKKVWPVISAGQPKIQGISPRHQSSLESLLDEHD